MEIVLPIGFFIHFQRCELFLLFICGDDYDFVVLFILQKIYRESEKNATYASPYKSWISSLLFFYYYF